MNLPRWVNMAFVPVYREIQASFDALEALGTAVVRSLPYMCHICIYVSQPYMCDVYIRPMPKKYDIWQIGPRNPSELRRSRGAGHRGSQVREREGRESERERERRESERERERGERVFVPVYREIQANFDALEALGTAVVRYLPYMCHICIYVRRPYI